MQLNISRQRTVALSTLAVLGATLLGSPAITPVEAKSKTWKKVAIGGAAVGAYGLLKGKKKTALIGGAVAGASYLKYRHDKKKENNRRSSRRWRR